MNKTKTELIKEMGTTKGTFYRHMSKIGIDKGKMLTDDDIRNIEISIKGKYNSTSTSTAELDKVNSDLKAELYNKNIEIEKLKKELEEIRTRLGLKENEINKLQTELTNNVVSTNQLSTEHIKLIQEFRLLATPQVPKNHLIKGEREIKIEEKADDVSINDKTNIQTKEVKKRWWRK